MVILLTFDLSSTLLQQGAVHRLLIMGDNSCRWVVFVSYQYMDRVNIRQPKSDTNNKYVNIC